MSDFHQHNKPHNTDFRKHLRKNLTPAEAYLWTHLKGKKLDGRKFRRQHGILDFVVDFFCWEEDLVIELDGQFHDNPTQIEKDKKRDRMISELGIKVLRFENRLVFDDLDGVWNTIREHFKSR